MFGKWRKFCQALQAKLNKDEQESWQITASFPIILRLVPGHSHNNTHKYTCTFHGYKIWTDSQIRGKKIGRLRTSAVLKCPHENLLKTLFLPFICSCNKWLLISLKHGKFTDIVELLTKFVLKLSEFACTSFAFCTAEVQRYWMSSDTFHWRMKKTACILHSAEAWQQRDKSTGSPLAHGLFSVCKAAQTEWAQPGWKCVKAVKGVWRSLFWMGSRLTAGWSVLRCMGCFDRR